MDLLRISTAGSVDDGKSTLIGRLLYDTDALTKEQEALIEKKTAEKGLADLDFSVITDGLIAEREQGITIDVAHIYFSTNKRKFIIADSPGHVEYTRNMVTGASNAEVSIILIDARKGLLEQSYRHFFISQLLRLHTVVFCINKMDLVDYSEDVFLKIAADIQRMTASFEHSNPNIEIIPISSLKGDNVVNHSSNTAWYQGETLNSVLHQIESEQDIVTAFRMDVQNVLHVQNNEFVDYRGYSGRVASGTITLGDEVMVYPSQKNAIVTEIRKDINLLENAATGDSVSISLDREIDISRGSIITKNNEAIPITEKSIKAKLVWLEEDQAAIGSKFLLQAGSKTVQVRLEQIHAIIPPENPSNLQEASSLKLNDIAITSLKLASPIFLDHYAVNKNNGAFILINPRTNNTCAVGFVE
ncbi:sulfate adenylyltransferase subunit 1 [Spongiivirga citrea]|uniref:sulfate adenylyltransferase n=1 Tax=Spongiivirga citrea TaxID=1481457 RepID=A0A6M0CJK8_9FLAO|nr:GTP-binding protein [Spongiivirga citrea]NER16164.1 sulfate adenylyltransferase [Spongiivirga citrea]